MVKAHTPINWENKPSTNTPINETNLNKMDSTIGILDDRIIAQDTTKLDKSTANTMVKDVTFAENTGIFTITYLNGSTKTLDTKLEKIATNFKYDYSTQTLILTLIDGTAQSIDMSALVTQYEFADSATLDFSVDSSGKVTATIKNGSITESMLEPNYLANIKVETAKSQQSMANAQTSENNAKNSANLAQSYAVGGTGTRDGEDTDNAKYYSENAKPVAQTITGSNPTATNSTQAPVIYMKNSGYTEQNTLSGKNLLEMNTTNFALTDNGIKNNVQGGAMGTVDLKAGVTYSLSLLLFSKPTADTSFVSKINNVDIGDFSFVTIDTYNLNEKFTRTYTATEDCTVSIGMYGNANVETIKFQLQLEEGSTATDYEPYCGCTASPNPDYPQRISGLADKGYFDGVLLAGTYLIGDGSYVDDDTEVMVCNKNKIPCSAGDIISIEYGAVTQALYLFFYGENGFIKYEGVTDTSYMRGVVAPEGTTYCNIRINGSNLTPSTAKHISVTINGKYAMLVKNVGKNLFNKNTADIGWISPGHTVNINTDWRHQTIEVKPNTTYTISGVLTSNESVYYHALDKDQQIIRQISALKNLTFTTNDDEYFVIVNVTNYDGHMDTTTFQLEEGDTATDYESYQETTTFIPTSGPLYEGDYFEEYADGSGKIVRNNASVVYDGSDDESWVYNGTNGSVYITATNCIKPTKSVLCTHFKSDGSYNVTTNNINIDLNGNLLIIPSQSSLSDWQAWLQSNPIHVVYKLATPAETELTPEQINAFKQLYTFDEVTHIYADGEVTVRYFINNNSGESAGLLQKQIDEIDSDVEDIKEEIDQTNVKIDERDIIRDVSGTNPSITDSTNAPFVYMKNEGYTEQKTLSGKNLCPYETISTTAAGNGLNKASISLKSGTTYTLQCETISTTGSEANVFTFFDAGGNEVAKCNQVNSGLIGNYPPSFTPTADVASMTAYFNSACTLTGVQIHKGSVKSDYEPYCGCTASPNPDYPQRISGLADKGYFDGVLQQGYYADELTIDTTSTSAVCSKNPIPCKEGDTIKVVHEVSDTTIDNKFDVVFLDSDKNYLSVQTSFTNLSDDVATAPTNAKYFLFSIRRSGYELSPSTAKHIYVTINGMYAVAVKTVWKNLLKNTATSQTIKGLTFTVNEDGSITANGTATDYHTIKIGEFKPTIGKTYCFSSGITSVRDNYVCYVNNVNGVDSWKSGTVTFKTTTEDIIRACISIYKGITVNNLTFYPQLEEGTVATDYEPYTETQALIPVSAPLYEGDYIEVYADGSGQIVRKKANVIIDSSRKPAIIVNGTDCVRVSFSLEKYPGHSRTYKNLFATRFLPTTQSDYHNMTVGEMVYVFMSNNDFSGYGRLILTIPPEYNTTALVQEYFTEHPTQVIYPLMTPTTKQLTAEQVQAFKQLQTFNEVTHITADGEVTLRYYCNTDSGDTVGMLHDMVESNKADLQEQIDKVGEINVSITTDFTVRHCKCRKQGNVVTLSLDLKLGCDCSKDTVLATLGEDARPSGAFGIDAMGLIDEDGNNLVPAMLSIWTDGTIHQDYGDNVWLERAVLHVSYVVE